MTEEVEVQANIESPLNSVEVATPPAAAEAPAAPSGPAIPEKFGGDVNKLVESYNHLESKMGSMYSIPSEDSSADRWKEFDERITSTGKYISRPDPSDHESLERMYNQLGRPESADKYSVQISEDIQPYVDDNMYNSYTQIAHKVGLNNDQAQALFDFETERMNQQAQQVAQSKANSEQQLRQSWGHDYDNRMAGAKAAASAYQEKYPDALGELLNGPSGNNPALIAILSELGSSMQESGHIGAVGTPQYGMSSDDARDKIREIMDNKGHPYFHSHDPGHKDAVSKVKKLYGVAYPEG